MTTDKKSNGLYYIDNELPKVSTDVLETPSSAMLDKWIAEWNKPYLKNPEDFLKMIFTKFDNLKADEVEIKVRSLNALYHTNLNETDVRYMIYNITHCDFDHKIKKGDFSVVDDIRRSITINGNERSCICFASKYCNWCDHNIYPIYDNYVKNLLKDYNKEYRFSQVALERGQMVKNYLRFYNDFISHFKIDRTKYTYKQIDMALWLYAKARKKSSGKSDV